MQETKDNLQRAINRLSHHTIQRKLNSSINKPKVMANNDKYPLRSKQKVGEDIEKNRNKFHDICGKLKELLGENKK